MVAANGSGYNVDFKESAIRAAQIGYDLNVKGITSFFSWPSQGSLEGYPGQAAAGKPISAPCLKSMFYRWTTSRICCLETACMGSGLPR